MLFSLIDPSYIEKHNNKLFNNAFLLWEQEFKNEANRYNFNLNQDAFFNSRLISILSNDSEVVGMMLHNTYYLDTKVTTVHSYFKVFSEESINQFIKLNKRSLLSVEYLLVNPKFRNGTINIAEVLIGLSYKILEHSPWDSIVGVARDDRNVSEKSIKMGGEETLKVVKNNTPCSIILVSREKIKENPNQVIQNTITGLWENKYNGHGLILDQQIQKIA